MSSPETLYTAQRLAAAGISVLRMKPNLEKRPDGLWKEFQVRRATPEELTSWFSNGAPLGVVTGPVSGNLVMAEIEGRAAVHLQQLRDVAHDSGLGEVWDKINGSWKEESPSGGIHWFFRQESEPAPNQKLATRPSTPEELLAWKARETTTANTLGEPQRSKRLDKIANTTVWDVPQVLAETRGKGGYVVAAPTGGAFHETGRPWTWMNTPEKLVHVTDEEAEAFLSVLRTIHVTRPEAEQGPPPSPFSRRAAANGIIDGTRPGDDYDRENWENILTPHGWTKLSSDRDGTTYWCRPGKRMGISATTGHSTDRDRMYVFTTSTDLPAEEPLSKFAVYAHLEHGGSYSTAASELRKSGWGKPAEILTGTPPELPALTADPDTRQDNQDHGRTQSPASPTTTETFSDAPPPSQLATVTDISEQRQRKQTTVAHTDDGNASLFVNEHASIVRYNPERAQWLTWEKTVWRLQQDKSGGAAVMLARETARGLPTNNEDARKWQVKSLSERGIMAMTRLARTDPRMIITDAELDNLPWELNTPAGPVNLRTGQLLPPDPSKFHTKQTAVAPDPTADRSRWLQFLDETFPHNQPMIDYIQRLAGYTLIGEVREHILPFGFGAGGNGKGVLIETLRSLLGSYATSTAPDFLMKTFGTEHATELAKLSGIRMAVCSEIAPDAKFDEARLNMLSGGDAITARFMRQDEFTFDPTHQLWLSGNYQPQVEGGGAAGIWRRLRLLPFTHAIPEEKVEDGLRARFQNEHGPAILAWMIEGAVAYAKDGLRSAEPNQVRQATEDYRKDAQTVDRFLEDECMVGDQLWTVPVRKLRNRYEQYCQEAGATPLRGKAFARELANAGVEVGKVRSGSVRFYGNVRLQGGQEDQEFPALADYSPGAAKD